MTEVRKIKAGKGSAVILPPFSVVREIEAEDDALLVLREMDPDEIESLIRVWRGEQTS